MRESSTFSPERESALSDDEKIKLEEKRRKIELFRKFTGKQDAFAQHAAALEAMQGGERPALPEEVEARLQEQNLKIEAFHAFMKSREEGDQTEISAEEHTRMRGELIEEMRNNTEFFKMVVEREALRNYTDAVTEVVTRGEKLNKNESLFLDMFDRLSERAQTDDEKLQLIDDFLLPKSLGVYTNSILELTGEEEGVTPERLQERMQSKIKV